MKISIIIPVYNEERTIRDILKRVAAVDLPVKREIVVVDDGSTDATPEFINRFFDENEEFVQVHTSLINIGKGVSVRMGLEKATGDIILIQDADKELSPEDIPSIIEPIVEGEKKAVFGSRLLEGKEKMFWKGYLANKFLVFLVNILYGAGLTDVETGYKAFKKELTDKLKLKSIGFEWEIEITTKLLRKNVEIGEVPVDYDPRSAMEGKIIGWWDGIKAIYYIVKNRLKKRIN